MGEANDPKLTNIDTALNAIAKGEADFTGEDLVVQFGETAVDEAISIRVKASLQVANTILHQAQNTHEGDH